MYLFPAPHFTRGRVGKLFGSHRDDHLVADALQGPQSALDVFGFQADDQIHIAGQALVAVRVDGQTADDQGLDVRVIQGRDDGFNAA